MTAASLGWFSSYPNPVAGKGKGITMGVAFFSRLISLVMFGMQHRLEPGRTPRRKYRRVVGDGCSLYEAGNVGKS